MAWRTGRVAKPAGLASLYYKAFRLIVLQRITNPAIAFLYYKAFRLIVLQRITIGHKVLQCIRQALLFSYYKKIQIKFK